MVIDDNHVVGICWTQQDGWHTQLADTMASNTPTPLHSTIPKPGIQLQTRMRTRTRRMREIFLTANPDTLASWFAWLRTRTREKSRAFASLIFYFCLFYNQTAFWRNFNHFGYCTSRQDHLSVWLSTDSKASFRGIVDARPMLFQCVKLISTFSFLFRCSYRISIRGYVRPSVRWSVGPSVRWSVTLL